MKQHDPETEDIAKQLTSYLNAREKAHHADEDKVWECIQSGIPKGKRNSKVIYLGITVTVAAAMIAAAWLFTHELAPDVPGDAVVDYAEMLSDKPVETAVNIQVILSDEEILSIEDGSIAYDTDGTVIIDEEKKVVTTPENQEETFNQIIVPYGKQTLLTLSDGSLLHINSGSRVVFPRVFKDTHREIYIEGEVFLDVARNEAAPFTVKTPDFSIKVLGTSFNINAYKDEASEVVLVKGAVELTDKYQNQLEMKPNQLTSILGGKLGDPIRVNTTHYTAWTRGLMVLSPRESLASVAKKLHRFYRIPITVSPEASTLTLEGTIDLHQSLDDLITILAATAPIRYTQTTGTYYIELRE